MAIDPDLDQCVVKAPRDMIALICEKTGLSGEDAYMLCSLAAKPPEHPGREWFKGRSRRLD
jgi:acetamidase/formamidase